MGLRIGTKHDDEIIKLRQEGKTMFDISRAIGCSPYFVQTRIHFHTEQGNLSKEIKVGKHQRTGINDKKELPKFVKTPKHIGWCEYPKCKDTALYRFSLVPVCEYHHEMLFEEAENHYTERDQKHKKTDRKHWDRIKERSAELWENQRANTSTRTRNKESQSLTQTLDHRARSRSNKSQ